MRNKLICIGVLTAAFAFAAADAGAGDNVPLKGKDTFSAAVVGGSGSIVETSDRGSGTATHMGSFTMVASETVDFAAMTVTNGRFTLTAANGDTVSGTYSGTILPGLVGYLVSGPITGGTGRFVGASGEIVFDGTFDPATFTGSDVISGTISTVGSN
jgi:hypothetical protein